MAKKVKIPGVQIRDITRGHKQDQIMNTQTLIASLESAPEIIVGLIREVPPQLLKRRPSPNKWSAHEHACHLATADTVFLSRLELMLSDPAPYIKYMAPSQEEEAGSLLMIDLDEALDQYVRERARLVRRLKELSAEDWKRTAEHEEYTSYSVTLMFRQLLTHEMLHAYRIEELMLKKDWE
ncbi:MAG TPA: DinB family protein [Blastocatellia bacterium]|nr:DinB family protein [Blastocatellia bacterium]